MTKRVGAGAVVNITINGKTTEAITDGDGIAKVAVIEAPGTYDVTTDYNGQTYKNKITVKLNPSTCKITQNKDIKVDYGGGKYFSVKIVSQDGKVAASGVSVTFKINGKDITVKTDKNGIVKVKITDVPGKYVMTTSFNGKSVKNTVIVKKATPKLTAQKKTFKVKKAKKYTVALKSNVGKAMKKVRLTIKVKGKTYKATTNAKGMATFNLKIDQKGQIRGSNQILRRHEL